MNGPKLRKDISASIVHHDEHWVLIVDTPDGSVWKRCSRPGPLLTYLSDWCADRHFVVDVAVAVYEPAVWS